MSEKYQANTLDPRNLYIRELLLQGVLYKQIGAKFGISRQRVCQIAQAYGLRRHGYRELNQARVSLQDK